MKRNVHFSTEGYKVEAAHVLAQIAMGACKIHHSATRNGYVSRRRILLEVTRNAD